MTPNRFIVATVATFAAQAAVAQDSTTVDPIVINAGQDKVASDVAQSVSVVNQEKLDEIQAANIGDILNQVPGVSGIGSSSPLGQSFNIRGVGAGVTSAASSILTLVDGEELYYESYRQGSIFVEPELLKRVEVLRGPGSSTLYGSGAMGGVVLMETKDARDFLTDGDTFAVRQKLTFESNEDKSQSTTILAFAPDDNFDALFALSYSDIGTSEDGDGNTLIRTNADIANVLAKANYTKGDHRFGVSYQHLYSDGTNQDFNQLDGSATFPWGVGNITTQSQVAKLEHNYSPTDNPFIDLTTSLSYTNSQIDVAQGTIASEPVFASLIGERSYELWKLKTENTADISGAAGEHYLTFGAAVSRKDRTSNPASGSHPEATTDTFEIYALSEFSPTDRLTINTGLRIDHQRVEPADSVTVTSDSTTGTAIEPQISAIYKLNENWNVLGSLARVNRLPTDDEIFDAFSGGAANLDLDPEKGTNTEIGVSYVGSNLFTANDEIDLKFTAFYNDIKDKIVRTNAGAGQPGFDNIDRAIIKGAEIEGRYVVGKFAASMGVTLIDGQGPNGSKLNSIANNSIMLGLSYQFTPEFKMGINSTFAADRTQDRGEFDGYNVHNVYATYSPDRGVLKGTEIHLGIDNIADTTYQPATYLSQAAKGRNIKLSLAKTF
ncbi:hypothetical protein BFP76_03270 [Amylibacter kogurei]|uniref:TonB-dependent receptor n=1 Tax=Paramylibacter kogurei TaxID=1889778 RepID=A0A2G5K3Y7_9RHOB|nr:TonB-dependent receptor [Amylibacter kogurei]PIB24256.1 hypothetical protein BFP76_03270 [Amylibacter kogurei]